MPNYIWKIFPIYTLLEWKEPSSSDTFHTFLSQLMWYVNYSWSTGHNFVAYYSFGQDVLLSPDPPANMPYLSPCPAHVWYFSGRQLWIKTLWTANGLSGSWKHLVQLLSGALGQGNTKVRKVKASGSCMISCIFGEQIQRKPENFSHILFYIGVTNIKNACNYPTRIETFSFGFLQVF